METTLTRSQAIGILTRMNTACREFLAFAADNKQLLLGNGGKGPTPHTSQSRRGSGSQSGPAGQYGPARGTIRRWEGVYGDFVLHCANSYVRELLVRSQCKTVAYANTNRDRLYQHLCNTAPNLAGLENQRARWSMEHMSADTNLGSERTAFRPQIQESNLASRPAHRARAPYFDRRKRWQERVESQIW